MKIASELADPATIDDWSAGEVFERYLFEAYDLGEWLMLLGPDVGMEGFFFSESAQDGFFHWAHDERELWNYMGRWMPFLANEKEVQAGVIKKTAIVADRAARGEIGATDAIDQLNRLLKGGTVVRWKGKVSDLFDSSDVFCRSIREEFHMGCDDEPGDDDDRPIEKNEIEDFLDFLSGYNNW